jgi:hypothetical protein
MTNTHARLFRRWIPRWPLVAVGALVTFLIGCAVLRMRPTSNDPQSELVFSHARHAQMDIECGSCHPAETSVLAADRLLPSEESCMTCHHREQGCELCHQNAARVVKLVPNDYGLRFSHVPHLRADVNPQGCAACHAAVEASTAVAQTYPIGQQGCQTCHREEMSSAPKCGYCHERLTPKTFVPVTHRSDWLREHASAAATSGGLCDVCHRGTIREDAPRGPALPKRPVPDSHVQAGDVHDCAGCHQADVWPLSVHDSNYLQSHWMDAAIETTTCESCHRREECMSCHRESVTSFASAHPPTFLFDHAADARRALGTCATCHEETTCVACHQSANPHPPGWEIEITAQNRALCVKCHVAGALP